MSETKHTPGPWWRIHRIIDAANGRHGHNVMERICIMDEGPTETEMAANARLIAAAPELLEACKACVDDLKHYVSKHGPGPDRRLDALQAAIAKAESK